MSTPAKTGRGHGPTRRAWRLVAAAALAVTTIWAGHAPAQTFGVGSGSMNGYGVPGVPGGASSSPVGGATGAGGGAMTPYGASSPTFSPAQIPADSARNTGDFSDRVTGAPARAAPPPRTPPPLSEFEKYVDARVGMPLPRFGANLLINGAAAFATPPTAAVPPDYRLNPGDELLVGITGSVQGDLRLVIDNQGQIFIPNVGAVDVAGLRYGDLEAAIARRLDTQYKHARVSVVIGHLHGITVYVTGYAVTPGSYTVSSLSTMVDAVLAAGGPAGGGSFRSVQLRRGGRLIDTLDLYDLLLKGDTSHDAVLENQDVLDIEPAGPELAITGSVNAEAIFEAKPGETLGDVIGYAGGLDSLADETRLLVARLADLDRTGSQELTFAQARRYPAERGDIVRILSLANIARPLERQAILATIEGEVDHPGRYYLKPGSTVGDLLAQAGGLTSGAYVFGTQFDRETLRVEQQESFDRAIADLQLSAAAQPLSGLGTISADRAAATAARTQAALALIDRLKERKPTGRLVLALPPDAATLPASLTLESDDRIYVPPRPKTVGVFGAVYQTGSFMLTPGARIGDYLRLAGGPERFADKADLFVVRANGSVVSAREVRDLVRQTALPGDVVFVPVRVGATTFEKILLASEIISQFGIDILTLHAVGVF